jgi:Ca-activated chloride channel family protein
MTFAAPAWLLFLLGLPVLVWLNSWADRQSERELEEFGEASLLGRTSRLPDQSGRRTRRRIRLAALALAIVALARPQLGERPSGLVRTGRDLLVLLDVSRSMRVTDSHGGTRLQTAKQLAWQLAAATPGDRLGLVIFGGAAFLQLPLTTDLAAYQLFLEAANPDLVDDPSTNLAAALRTAATTFEHEGDSQGHRAVLLISDGERTVGPLEQAMERIRKAGIPVFAVGVGSLAGGRIPADSGDPAGPWHLDDIGRPVVSHLVEEDLRRIVEGAGGLYAREDQSDALARLTARLAELPARALTTKPATERIERFQWPLAAAILLLAVDLFWGLWPQRRRALIPVEAVAGLVVIMLLAGSCSRESADLRKAERLYENGNYQAAFDLYQHAAQHQDNPALDYNTGNAQYRLRRYEEAVKTYRSALSGDAKLRQWAYFNLGNAYVRAAEEATDQSDPLKKAVSAFEEAVRLDPGDPDAKWNLELALRRLGESEEAAGGPGMGGRAEWGRGNMTKSGYPGGRETQVGAMAGGGQGDAQGESAEELDEPQARRLLEAIEREQLASHEARPVGGGAKAERDW